MTERPIIFSPPMVQAILEGRKTQTRRIIPRDIVDLSRFSLHSSAEDAMRQQRDYLLSRCRYGSPCDRMWVREPWCESYTGAETHYRADRNSSPGPEHFWRHAMFMPKSRARLWLEITHVRIDRVQAIDEIDAKAEGVEASSDVMMQDGSPCYTLPFQKLWTSLHGIDNPKSWEANPWVWVIGFRRVH